MGWQDELYKPAKGDEPATVLGRTAGSWARVLAFYAVYYSLLFCLFYGFTIKWYQGRMPNAGVGDKPYVFTRIDQPGVGLYPLKNLGEYKVNARPTDIAIKTGSASKEGEYVGSEEYVTTLANYFTSKPAGGEDCTTKKSKVGDDTQIPCKTSTAPLVARLKAQMALKQPFVSMQVNKIINWEPTNLNSFPEGTTTPVKNAIYVSCEQWATKLGKRSEEQEFEFEFFNGRNYIGSEFFPYLGLQKEGTEKTANGMIVTDYQSEWVGLFLKKKDGAWGSDYYSFRCEIYADNIDRPSQEIAPGKQMSYSASQDLVKLQVGVVDFGFKWE